MMLSLVYVSRPRHEPIECAIPLDDLLAVATARNSALNITGVLIAAPSFFAGLLEGPAPCVETVMADVMNDPRHEELRIVRRSKTATRRFQQWQMIRFSSANFHETGIDALFAGSREPWDADVVRKIDRLFDRLVSPAPI